MHPQILKNDKLLAHRIIISQVAAGEDCLLYLKVDKENQFGYSSHATERSQKYFCNPVEVSVPLPKEDLVDVNRVYKASVGSGGNNNVALREADERVVHAEEHDNLLKRKAKVFRDPNVLAEIKNKSWLRQTEYMSNYLWDTTHKSALAYQQEAERINDYNSGFTDIMDENNAVERIEATFAKAREPPVHLTNKNLRAVKVFPLLPDDDLVPNLYNYVTFDDNPKPRYDENGFGGSAGKVNSSIIRTVDRINKSTYITSFFVPPDRVQEDEPNTYDFVREYKCVFNHGVELEDGTHSQEYENFVIHWNKDGDDYNAAARFAPLHYASIDCKKRPMALDKNDAKGSNLTFSRRAWTEQELQSREQALIDLDTVPMVVDDTPVGSPRNDNGDATPVSEAEGGSGGQEEEGGGNDQANDGTPSSADSDS